MTRADLYSGLLLVAFFGACLWEGSTFQYGEEFSPGPGFAPVWLSAIGLCVALLITAHGIWSMQHRTPENEAPTLELSGVVRVVLTLLGMVAMILLVPLLGLVLAILAFLLFLTLVVQRHSLLVGIAASVGTVVFVYVVFVYSLDVPIPKGPLGL
jgi:hypothetical protein